MKTNPELSQQKPFSQNVTKRSHLRYVSDPVHRVLNSKIGKVVKFNFMYIHINYRHLFGVVCGRPFTESIFYFSRT